ncbi:MAG: response regulator transcription factor [Polaromonas sp.]|nr:response regulator transcription factor [Polaromonas sp.]
MTSFVPSVLLDRANSDVVLIVDDVPDNLSLLHDALDEAGYTVLLATNGEAALTRALQALPDIVLLDAMMPGMDGFEVARRLKASLQTAHIPIIFMTGLTETEYLVAALDAGGVDYVTKPLKPREVMARMTRHLKGARDARGQAQQAGQARNALDAFGYASITVRMAGRTTVEDGVLSEALDDGKLVWQTPLARDLLMRYWGTSAPQTPQPVLAWLRRHAAQPAWSGEPPRMEAALGPRCLTLRLHRPPAESDGRDWLIVMRETSEDAVLLAMADSFKLTAREAEVLYWLVRGKVNRDIGDILGTSPATVKKHLERIYVKLGVETRTAAAGLAMSRIQQLHPMAGSI